MNAKPIISLSTSCLRRIQDGYELMQKAASLGFEYVELGHSTTVSQIDGILKAIDEGFIKASSVHNFCPVPPFAQPPAPNLFSPATNSDSESAQWRMHTLNTLNFADAARASRMVMHAGELFYFWLNPKFRISLLWNDLIKAKNELQNLEEESKEKPGTETETERQMLLKKIERLQKKYDKLLEAFIKKSEKKSEKSHEKIFENTLSIHAEFAARNILIGIENRDGWNELPFDTLFSDFASKLNTLSHARAWIDVGHAQIKALRGIINLQNFLETTHEKICGWHLHDTTQNGADHKALGAGITDFNLVKKYFNPQKQIFVLELNPSISSAEIVDSRKRLEDMF